MPFWYFHFDYLHQKEKKTLTTKVTMTPKHSNRYHEISLMRTA